jgi:nitrite reductase/ring-hydroxylating ferredoxin subunit
MATPLPGEGGPARASFRATKATPSRTGTSRRGRIRLLPRSRPSGRRATGTRKASRRRFSRARIRSGVLRRARRTGCVPSSAMPSKPAAEPWANRRTETREGDFDVAKTPRTVWYEAPDPDALPEGRVMTKALGVHTVCMTRFEGQYAALSNKCPHQGGPLGEGSSENGLQRCPWHGWDYHPTTGALPKATATAFPRFPSKSATAPSMSGSRRTPRTPRR